MAHTQDTKNKIAAAKRGSKHSASTCQAISDALKGVRKSPQHREKLRIAALAREARARAERAPN